MLNVICFKSYLMALGIFSICGSAVAGNVAKIELDSGQLQMSNFRWENGVIPFAVDGNLTATETQFLTDAINAWEAATTIRFDPITEFALGNPDRYAYITNSDGCRTDSVGPYYLSPDPLPTNTAGRRSVFIGGCDAATFVHELGHIIGLIHEHQRDDRDYYVTHNPSNLNSNAFAITQNFAHAQTWGGGQEVGNYDYQSIMHYGTHTFANSPNATDQGSSTLWPADPFLGHGFDLIFNASNVGYQTTVAGGVVAIQQSDVDTVDLMYNRTILKNKGSQMCLKSYVASRGINSFEPSLDAFFRGDYMHQVLINGTIYSEETNKVYLSDCSGQQYNQEWVISPSGKLLAANGWCLTLRDRYWWFSDPAYKEYTVEACQSVLDSEQGLTYDAATKQLQDSDGNCISSTIWSSFGSTYLDGETANELYAGTCIASSLYQQWELADGTF